MEDENREESLEEIKVQLEKYVEEEERRCKELEDMLKQYQAEGSLSTVLS